MIRLSLLIGLPALALLGLLGFRLRWMAPALWRGMFAVGSVLAGLYLVWAAWKTFSVV
ncbi:hypothetical protein DEIPH_ctg004orf0107 [Deinococcus phoenicis]|uniref:Uncharacterized protein n=1 Tax=Deinococcus phoenicis TaxID=1476583 RepID=A0A016QUF0_9DEIO|nr:hypothetical protein [Deinococcus phoenicis]EYB69586.1 hypothetical protein DEIPH_ctg004orf0107 [Deinococcus phoenicis]